ncbi:MAG: aminotransferase class V-fold PLP-dependent enzyme [Candidatus Hermodarchaeota archaeon]
MIDSAFTELERGVHAALETYSNVHRGTGHNSMITTALFERARDIVLEYLNLDKDKFMVVFCSPLRSRILKAQLNPVRIVSSQDIGLPLGIRALAVRRSTLSKRVPLQTGGGVVKMVNSNSVVWADAPKRFEVGTPSIINVITLAKALQMIKHFSNDIFKKGSNKTLTPAEILYQDDLLGYTGKELLLELRQTFIGRDICVPTVEGESPYINLDNAASTPTFSPIWDVVCRMWKQPDHIRRGLVREVKKICLEFLDAPLDDHDVVFTSNTTEAINVVAQRLVKDFEEDIEPVIVSTLLEHNSNELPWRYSGASIIRLLVDDEGFLDLNELENLFREYNQNRAYGKKRIRIVTVSGASNVLGTINDIQAISRIVHEYGAHLLVDGAQLVAHRKISMVEDGIDFLAFSGHKIYAPFGAGALIFKKGLLNFNSAELTRLKLFGEENVVGIATIGKAITLLQRVGMDIIEEQERVITRTTLFGLSKIPDIEIFGIKDPNSPRFHKRGSTIVFSLRTVPHNLVAKELAEYGGIGVRNGCFCSHLLIKRTLKIAPFRTFIANVGLMILPLKQANKFLPGLVRVSFGIENDENDVEYLIKTLEKITREPRSRINKFFAFFHTATPFVHHKEIEKQMINFSEAVIKKVYSSAKN